MAMTYAYIAITDREIPRASCAIFQHLLDTYASETNKVISVWREFTVEDLLFRPHPRSSARRDIFKRQLLSAGSAAWLQKEHTRAASGLLEGLEETFKVNRLGLTATLMKCLTTTNIIENPNGTVRRQTRRVSRWQDGAMVLRWAARALLNAEKKFRRVTGHRELWMLENALKTLLIDQQPVAELAQEARAA